MGRTFALLAALLLLVGPFAVHGQAPTAAADKPRLAVLGLEARKMREEGEAATEELRKAFVKSGRYTVIDRTLTEQIMKEWETQQSGLTDQDRALRVGKLFNVKLIVAGRINRIGENGWQVSAAMLDAESGVTKNAETIRHQGDVFGLLNDKIPVLAAALAGSAGTSSVPAGTPRSAAPAPVSRKLAIFPALLQGQNARDFLNGLAPAEAAVVKTLGSALPEVAVSHKLSDNQGLGKDVWSGVLSKEPDMDLVLRRAKDLGVNLVLMVQSRSDPDLLEYNAYLIDADNLRQYRRKGTWTAGNNPRGWVPTIGRAAAALVIEAMLTQASHWPNPPVGTKLTEAQLRELIGKSATFYYLVPDSVGIVEYVAGGVTKVRHPQGTGEGRWRQAGDRICVTPSNAPAAKEGCSNRYDLGNGLYRAGDDSGKSFAVFMIKP